MQRKIIWFFAWPIYRLFVALFFKFEVQGKENYQNLKKPFILAANHASYLDGELIVVAFPWNSEFFPIRYTAAEYYYNKIILGTILWILGGFPIIQGMGLDKSLAQAISLLKGDEVVGIFPEGRMTKDGKLCEGKPGVAYLTLKTGLPILPVGVSGTFGLNPLKILSYFLFRRKPIKITFGKPFYLQDQESLIKGAQIVMDKIKELV